jgi:O-antigen/teichoic acid export membrane protein
MLKKILGTTGTRILNALFNLIILLLISNKIGSEGLGTIGLILLDITIIQLVVDLVGGSPVIYYTSRTNISKLILPAYLWILITVVAFFFLSKLVLLLFPLLYETTIPSGYEWHILSLALLNALMLTHYNILIGKGKIKQYNIIFTLQITSLLVSFLLQLYLFQNFSVASFLNALYVGYGLGAILGFGMILFYGKDWSMKGWRMITLQVLRYGFITQVANLLNIGNKRFSYYFIKYFSGLYALGIFTAGVQLTEGLRVIGQSISLVQFSAISNTDDKTYARQLTIKLMKFSVLFTLSAVLVLILLPESVYTWLFSKEFEGVKVVIIALSPGVVALAANNIFSHYFSGLGNPKINLWSNVIGFVFTIVLAVILIPMFGITGAAITTSASYISSVVYQYIIFCRQTHTSFSEWLPRRSDYDDFRKIVSKALNKEENGG